MITGLHIPCGDDPLVTVTVDERNAISYYPYVSGGPVEAAVLTLGGHELAVYVNSRYLELGEERYNAKATRLFEIAGVGMSGGHLKGDALAVLARGRRSYERSIPTKLVELLVESGLA